ncbi:MULTISPECIES: hypothetical protein [Mycobacterium]|uniref:Uncharacterized protein n=1 Tax=Mycobacterium kiyosense TaxID=2871094 RepID=A0A9P3Q5W4_9MYCO|nr:MULTISPECIES: hypothetical protein [Mycobacterium]BDB43318.1 hypothetical protein IWGMT90018_37640 [Mycobacterium kiyosense]BDE13510.1 hypothetical protein MKCMC460_23700 [Mycobacterium sp. 20KCMC460]GLB84152.1 hypothetical protein SRL2020028_34080 [Mycobacterium kiyosense]GLB88443.1 hypothetical protein SRL2020130_12600 [Mycobacterium kiyosense]GLB94632.1 hypothetical protein SRL2020226_14080 [Mycobacterium kiyosense]
MTERQPQLQMLDIQIEPNHQAIGAQLALGLLDANPKHVHRALTRAAVAGLDATLAILTVQTRNLVVALMLLQGSDATRAALQRTLIDADLDADPDNSDGQLYA